MTIELDTTLAQADVLFLSFAQLVADIDRRRAENDRTIIVPSRTTLRNRAGFTGDQGGTSLPQEAPTRRSTIALPTISENLREMLQNGP